MGDIADLHGDMLYDYDYNRGHYDDRYREDGAIDECVEFKIIDVVAESDKAWLVLLERHGEIWFPKSRCEIEDGVLYVPEWLVEKKGIR